uniref:Venom peptide Ld14a n=1 Tax=Lethocerus distinctifemur TaxID=280095 RepID=A0A2K8JRT9_9HEMI|nr:venom peptide Ld14a [Lethocerus distinctifemur]
MKSLSLSCLVLAVVAVAGSSRLQDPCTPGYCSQVDCRGSPTPEQCQEGFYDPAGSKCGCCPSCTVTMPMFGECSKNGETSSVSEILRLCPSLGVCFQGRCHPLPR